MITKLFTSKEVKTLQADLASVIADRDNLKEQLSKIASVKESADFKELQADRDSIFNELQALKEQATTHANMVNALNEANTKALEALRTEHGMTLESLKADYETQISNLKGQIAKEQTSSEAKAISTLAKIGVPADELPQVTENSLTPTNVSEQMAKDKTFFAKHKTEILKLAGIDPERWEDARTK